MAVETSRHLDSFSSVHAITMLHLYNTQLFCSLGKLSVTAKHFKLYKKNQTERGEKDDYGCCECIEISLQHSVLGLKACLTPAMFLTELGLGPQRW